MPHVLPPSLLFDFSLRIPRINALPRRRGRPVNLPETARLPYPARLERPESPLDVRAAWNPQGFGCQFAVSGRTAPPQSSAKNPAKRADSVLVFLDTRPSTGNHRATAWCVSYRITPFDPEHAGNPAISFHAISQQPGGRESNDLRRCLLNSAVRTDGYDVEAWIPAELIHGFDEIGQIGRIGFYCIVDDTEHGPLHFGIGDDFPVTIDPSTWVPLELEQ